MAQQRPHQADIRIDVESYPNLKLLCWNLATPRVTCRDAFAIYERNWRWIDAANTPPTSAHSSTVWPLNSVAD